MGNTKTYERYQSNGLVNDIFNNKGVFSGNYWEHLFLIMGYEYEMIQKSMELWKDNFGYYHYRAPSGGLASGDGIFAAYIVQAMDDENFKKKYFYESYTTDLKSYLLMNGSADVKAYINGKFDADILRQEKYNEYWENKDWSISY